MADRLKEIFYNTLSRQFHMDVAQRKITSEAIRTIASQYNVSKMTAKQWEEALTEAILTIHSEIVKNQPPYLPPYIN